MLTTSAKNDAANAIDLSRVSLHSADPGQNGANEISGGTYARKTATYGAAANGARTLSASVLLDVPAGITVSHVCIWNAAGTSVKDVLALGTPETFSNAGVFELKTHSVTVG